MTSVISQDMIKAAKRFCDAATAEGFISAHVLYVAPSKETPKGSLSLIATNKSGNSATWREGA